MGKATEIQVLIALGGIGLCFLGFLRRPQSSFELIAPRFGVAFLFLVGFYLDFFYWAFHSEPYQYEGLILTAATTSLLFLSLCVIGFWIGFYLPFGRKLARKATVLHTEVTLPDSKLYLACWVITLTVLVIVLASSGLAFLDNRRFSGVYFFRGSNQVLAVMVQMLMALGAMAIGMAWPMRGQWGRRFVLLGLLIAIASPNFAKFSRGAGLAFAMAAVAYALRHRRFNWMGLAVAALLCAILANAGLSGRGLYGRAGVIPYLTHTVDTLSEGVENTPDMVFSAVGKFSVTSVVVRASTGDIFQSPWWKWVWFQTPLPRPLTAPLGLTPTGVGLSVKHFIGGVDSRGYTPSMFGDAWGHMGWWGFLAFIPVGIIARFIEAIAIRPTVGGPATLNIGATLVPLLYMALMLGFHNTYRSFVVAISYPTYLVLITMVLARVVGTRGFIVQGNPKLIR